MTNQRNEIVESISDFPDYLIARSGRVFNKKTNKELVWSPNTYGDLTVGLFKYGIQYRRSLKVLVANAFVLGRTDIFNTPIQIDGNKFNVNASNIVWRPRWFAWEYTHQFNNFQSWYNNGPIMNIDSWVEYKSIFQAAIATASLCKHIHAAIPSQTHVFPGGEKYMYI